MDKKDLSLNDSEEPTQPTLQTLMEMMTAGFNQINERFNTVNERLDTVNERLDTLEAKAYETKPIWERALAEILELKGEVAGIKNEVVQIKNKVSRLDGRLQNVERVMVALVADSELLAPSE